MIQVVKLLYERGESREDIIKLLRFIDWLLALPEKLKLEARLMLSEIEKEKTMPYLSSFERLAKEEGKVEGRVEGREEGLRQGFLEAIKLDLELRFGKEGLKLLPRVEQITAMDRLRKLKEAILTAKSVEEFAALLR